MQYYIKPMLSDELSRPFDNKEWLFEYNHGGYRAISVITDQKVNIYSFKKQSFNQDFPLLEKELSSISSDVVLDGEIVMLNEEGKPDFQKLINYKQNPHLQIRYYIFDLLLFEGRSLLQTPLIKRKYLLEEIFQGNFKYLKYNNFVIEDGCDIYKSAIKAELEGITAKKMESYYHPGKISPDWLKIGKNISKEVYICGFTKPSVKNKQIGSIIAGFKENNSFSYSGHIVAGLDNLYIQQLYTQLIPLVTDESPFETEIKSKNDIVWVHPVIKCEVKYLDITKNHLMRQPVFLSVKNEINLKTYNEQY